MVQKELLDKVQGQLTAAEEALAAKQGKIDQMKQEIFQKEKELETISVFQAQVGEDAVLTPRQQCVLFAVSLYTPLFVLCAGGGLFLRLLRGASSKGEAPRGEGAPGYTAGVCEETEHPAAGRARINGPVCNQWKKKN